MSTGTAAPNYHGQLVANTVDTITMDRPHEVIEVVNVTGTSRIDYTVDGSTPVVGGSPTGRALPAAPWIDKPLTFPTDTPVVIKLISAGTPSYAILSA